MFSFQISTVPTLKVKDLSHLNEMEATTLGAAGTENVWTEEAVRPVFQPWLHLCLVVWLKKFLNFPSPCFFPI